jgi:2-methylcitrate dehydratase PrpD
MEESKDSLAYRFGKFSNRFNYDFVPPGVIEAAKSYILDWFGCALAGLGEPSTQSLLRVARELNGRADATVLGSGDKMEPTLAALVNGAMSHALEMDDDHRTLCGHPGVAVIPAALAVSEKFGLSGKQFIEAVIVGYEMMIRAGSCFLGRAYYAGWHPTSTSGVFGAAAAASKAMGLSAEQTATAFGLAGSMSGGTLEYTVKRSYAKRFHPGNAARNGILAAMMARDGFTGPWSIFEGKAGWFETQCEKVAEVDPQGKPVLKKIYDSRILCDGLGENYFLLENSFKVHCGGRFGSSANDAALEIVKGHNLRPEQVREIRVGACDYTNRAHFSETCRRPKNIVQAQFSIPFAMALILLYRKVSVAHFTEEDFHNPRVIEIMDKVLNYIDPEAEAAFPQHYIAIVTMTLKDGTQLKARVDYPRGDPENRPTTAELHEKFLDLAGITLAGEKAKRLLEVLKDIEKAEKIAALTALATK